MDTKTTRPVRVLVASDKWKETLTSKECAAAISLGLFDVFGDAVETSSVELSDGGDGFLASLAKPLGLEVVHEAVTGPLGTPVESQWGFNSERGIAVVEMSLASGLALVPVPQRNPLRTTTRGTGELLLRAYRRGFRRILLGVGGSATNDAGLGALHALGLDVVLRDGSRPAVVVGGMLGEIASMSVPAGGLLPGARIEISCDVDTPLVGDRGATAVFSAQKGATEADRAVLEAGVLHASGMFPDDVRAMPGAGAAGGLPGGLRGFLGQRVTLRPGFDIIADAHQLEERIAGADLVITGEGAYDATSEAGKVVTRVLEICDRKKVAAVVLCGQHRDRAGERDGKKRVVLDLLGIFPLERAMEHPFACLHALVKSAARTLPVLSLLVPGL